MNQISILFYSSIHQRNIRALTVEIYKTLNDLNPTFINELFCLKEHNYPIPKTKPILPKSTNCILWNTNLGYNAKWGNIPKDIKEVEDISTFKRNIINYCESICNCNLCKCGLP